MVRTILFAAATFLAFSGAALAHNHDTSGYQQFAQHSGHGANHGASGHSGHGAGHEGHGTQDKAAKPDDAAKSQAIKDYEAVMAKMHEGMNTKYTGDVEVDFVQGMIPHHQGAIDMAKVLLEHGSDPRLKRLAQGIIAAQQKEINFMKNWLKERGANQ